MSFRRKASGESADATSSNAQHRGYVTKCGGSVRSWKRRWMVLKDGVVYYYSKESAKTPKGSLELSPEDSAHAVRNSDKSPFMFGINTSKRTYLMYADSVEEQQQWLAHVAAAVAAKAKRSNADLKRQGASGEQAVSPAKLTPSLSRLRGEEGAAKRSMSLSEPGLTFEPRDKLLFVKDKLQWALNSAVMERFWELWIRHLPSSGSLSDDEDDDMPITIGPADCDTTHSLQFNVRVAVDRKIALWEGVASQHVLVQRVVDFLYAVGADDNELKHILVGAGAVVRPTDMSLWTEMSEDGVVEGGYALHVVRSDAEAPLRALVDWMKHATLSQWFATNEKRVSLCQVWRECSTRANKCYRLSFAARAAQVELLIASLGFPPLSPSVVTALRFAKQSNDAPFEVLRLFAFDDGTIGVLEVVLPDEATTKLAELSDVISAVKSRPTHICHRLVKEGYDADLYGRGFFTAFEWRGLPDMRETFAE